MAGQVVDSVAEETEQVQQDGACDLHIQGTLAITPHSSLPRPPKRAHTRTRPGTAPHPTCNMGAPVTHGFPIPLDVRNLLA